MQSLVVLSSICSYPDVLVVGGQKKVVRYGANFAVGLVGACPEPVAGPTFMGARRPYTVAGALKRPPACASRGTRPSFASPTNEEQCVRKALVIEYRGPTPLAPARALLFCSLPPLHQREKKISIFLNHNHRRTLTSNLRFIPPRFRPFLIPFKNPV